ncbi:MAG: metallophosphoesterase family protein [Chloroflexota bacterium]
MTITFLHAADFHLGYRQYGSDERFDDFSRMFLRIVDAAVDREVDFVLLAGDLFEKRRVDPMAMRVAIQGLEKLRERGIPVLAVEGNHERSYYREQYTWVDFLDAMGYFQLLDPRFDEARMVLEPCGEERGAYVDLPGGVRVYGLRYYGASTGKVFGMFADALAEMDHPDVAFTILMAHAGVEDQLPHYSGTLKYNDLAPLRGQVDYLALGHIHKPYDLDGWIYNPGSPETCGMDEVGWGQRGYYMVEISPGESPAHHAELIPADQRRSFHRLVLEVDEFGEPGQLYDGVRRLIRRKDADISRSSRPVVALTLHGVLPFNRFDLDLGYVEKLLDEAWSPLIARVRNEARASEYDIDVDTQASRPELERSIIQELLERDARFRPAAPSWAKVALDVKRLVLEGSSSEAVIDVLRQARAEISLAGEEG